MKAIYKLGLSVLPMGLVAVGGYYVVDRLFVKKLPLYPFNLKKAEDKKANDALSLAKKKLNALMEGNKINGFGIVADPETKKNYIEIATDKITKELKSELPEKVKGVEVKLVERPKAKAL